MWNFLLEPGTQAAAFVLVALALGFVVWDLYDEARDPSPRPAAAPRRRRAEPAPEAAPRRPRVADSSLEIWTDAQGETRGRVTRGPSRGRRLEEMGREECEAQLAYARDHDPRAVVALELYIRHRFAKAPAPRPDGLTRAEALAEFGLGEAASDAEIQAAYRKLIKKHHPDHGGSHAKAARLNQAKAALGG